jgi:hypothetical protein
MSEHMQSGAHLDADSLCAFLEGALPEHERQACLAHIAECPECREAAFLSQEPAPQPVPAPLPTPAPAPFWRRWFVPAAVAGAAAAAILTFAVLRHPEPQPPVLVASNGAPSPPQIREEPAAAATPKTEEAPSPVSKRETLAKSARPVAPVPSGQARGPEFGLDTEKKTPAADAPTAQPGGATRAASAAPPVSGDRIISLPIMGRNSPPPVLAGAPPSANAAPAASTNSLLPQPAPAFAVVSGVVTDPAGAGISSAAITLSRLGAPDLHVTTDASGKFDLEDVQPGRYDLRAEKPGFQTTTAADIQARPQERVTVPLRLAVGASTQSVQVTASAEVVQINGSVNGLANDPKLESKRSEAEIQGVTVTNGPVPGPVGLPNGLPPVSVAEYGRIKLELDFSGALFRSDDAGKTWKLIKSGWKGKAVSVNPAPASAGKDKFQLANSDGAIWLSADGRRWHKR